MRLILVNDQITTLLFGGLKKYYDGSVALYISYLVFGIYLSVIQQSQSFFLIRSNKKSK